jgi:outer membrane protein assembly factor BamB
MKSLRLIAALVLVAVVCLTGACNSSPVSRPSYGTTGSQTTESSLSPSPAPEPTLTPEPTPSPSPSPAPAPPVTDPAELTLKLGDLPGYAAGNLQSDGSSLKTTDAGKIRWWVYQNGSQLVKNYQPDDIVAFGDAETYTGIEGVLTFRGNNYRDSPTFGAADVTEKKLEVVWTRKIGAISGTNSWWPGAGWTGQPLLVHWPEETRRVMGIKADMKEKDLIEVLYPVFDGHIYGLDLETGEDTRDPIHVGFAFKGNDTNGHIGAFRYRIFDLIQNKEISGIAGKDAQATHRNWGAFDASALINWQSDTLIEPGENGLLYKVKLNTKFDPSAGTVSVDPEIIKFRYNMSFITKYGVESSPVAYRNLVYFSDNCGAVVCVDINTLEPVWVYNAGDDSDATMVLEETDEGVFLYQGNTLDHRGNLPGTSNDICQLRKLDALSGKLVWQYDIPVVYDSNLNAGLLATPLLGKDDLSDMVIFNVCKTTGYSTGNLLALDKKTGKAIWNRKLDSYSWSSPIAVKGKDGKSYGIFCDSAGIMHLFDPLTGEDYTTLSIGGNCEASPAAYNDMIVVATYDCKIYCVKIS